jgi:hypothetical protein
MSTRATRRAFLAAAPALAGLAGLAPASAALHPDAELLAACARFADLVQRMAAAYRYDSDAWNDEAERAADALEAELRPHIEMELDRLTTLHATTLDGLRVRAATLCVYAPDFVTQKLTEGDFIDRQAAALLRDVLAIAGTAQAHKPA